MIETRQILEKLIAESTNNITDHKATIANAESKLAALDKPEFKPKHGDYGYSSSPGCKGRIALSCDFKIVTAGTGSVFNVNEESNKQYYPSPVLGNIFDDLKAMSEPLEEFNFGVHYYRYNLNSSPNAPIHISGDWYTIDEATEFYHQFGRVLATAKKEANK